MGHTYQRINKTRHAEDYADLRREVKSKEFKNLSKHKNHVFDLIEQNEYEDEYDLAYEDPRSA